MDKEFIYKKKYGQNFLQDENILNNIIRESDISSDTLVIEIGVGSGALTKKLIEVAKQVIGYEIDTSLKEILDKKFNGINNLDIIYGDFLSRNIKEDLKKYKYDKLMFVANLPYYITTPIITKIIDDKIDVSKMVLMVQNEVADRFNAKIGSKSYGSLTVYLNYYFDIKKAFIVSRNCFYPIPNVDSAVVIFNRKISRYSVTNEELFFNLVKDAFKQKRKTLKNNLYNYDVNLVNEVLQNYGKDTNYRAEMISIDEFIDIANKLAEKKR